MGMTKQKMHMSLEHCLHAVLCMVGVQPREHGALVLFDRPYPTREKVQREAVCCSQAYGVCRSAAQVLHLFTHLVQAPKYLFSNRAKSLPGWRKADGLRRAFDKCRTHPFLKAAYTPAESWLRGESELGGASEVACVDKTEEVLKPLQFHRHFLWGCAADALAALGNMQTAFAFLAKSRYLLESAVASSLPHTKTDHKH
jgi:hypothetical protein